jgi:hypothetical protein
VRPGHRGIHADIPGDQPLRVRAGLQPGQHPPPGAIALPAAEQAKTCEAPAPGLSKPLVPSHWRG